jgi:CMP-N-acetylneuraminic acid synthetase/quercetin dioxygenase-like cupin family protein
MKVVCMIPARGKSSRIPKKNLRLLGNKPLVSHVLSTCTESGVFDEIFLNSDDSIFEDIANDHNVSFYKRSEKFAEPQITNDLFMYDFLKNTKCDCVIQVNPTAPFLKVDDIKNVFRLLTEEGFETVQSLKEERIEGLFQDKPLNFDTSKIMPESQNLDPVYLYSSGIMGFKRDVYLKNMDELGAATYGGNGSIGYHITKGFSNIDIDYEEDFQLAEVVYEYLSKINLGKIKYYDDEDNKQIADADRKRILVMDGVNQNNMHDFNKERVHIPEIIEKNGRDKSWSHTLINSPSNSATIIAQMPGEGNRMHHHPLWDEWWYIIEGEWEWLVEGVQKIVKHGDLVFIERNRKHQITALGSKMSIRLAVSREDVDHVYDEKDYK